ncbi:hypothetical protein [Streptomyces sp. NPDC002845]
MPSVHTLPPPSSPAQVFVPWRTVTPGQALPWRSLASLGLDPDPGAESVPGGQPVCRAQRVPGAADGESPGTPDVVESAPVPRRPVRDHHPIPQES